MSYIRRTVEDAIINSAKSFPCVVIYGPRQVGKSTTAAKLFGTDFRYVTLDDAEDRQLAVDNPRLFAESYGWPLVIDEIQKAPLLLNEIKKIIDKQRTEWTLNGGDRRLMYVLTGSNQFELQQGISDSLAGRCGVIDMNSFSAAEKYAYASAAFTADIGKLMQRERESVIPYRTRSEVFEDIFIGGMPDVVTGNSQRDIYFKSYVSTYIEKDVRKLIAASSENSFRNFISIIALRTACELHYDEIASAVGIDTRTCRQWISILETSGIVFLLQPFLSNISNRIIKAPKMYFMDTGLCAYLCKWPNAEMLENCAMGGAFFETYVVSEIIKNFYAYNKDPREQLFYYRDKDQKEIDLIYTDMDKLYPIEIKKGINAKNPTKNFSVLKKFNMSVQPGLVIDTCDKIRPINDQAYSYPVFMLGA